MEDPVEEDQSRRWQVAALCVVVGVAILFVGSNLPQIVHGLSGNGSESRKTSGAIPAMPRARTGGTTSSNSSPPLTRFVTVDRVEERLGPSKIAKVTNTLHCRQQVSLYEVREGWARISPYYDGSVEGAPVSLARWVPFSSLSISCPPELPQPVLQSDPRIAGLPKVGQGGVTDRDVKILQAAAMYYLETGVARRIEYGDKSVNRPGVYYLNFGGPTNHFFTAADIPGIEHRMKSME